MHNYAALCAYTYAHGWRVHMRAVSSLCPVYFSLPATLQFVHLYCAALTAQTVTSAQSYHARRPNRTATFSVCAGSVRVSGLHHGTVEVVSSSLLALTLQNCLVRWLVFWDSQISSHPQHWPSYLKPTHTGVSRPVKSHFFLHSSRTDTILHYCYECCYRSLLIEPGILESVVMSLVIHY